MHYNYAKYSKLTKNGWEMDMRRELKGLTWGVE